MPFTLFHFGPGIGLGLPLRKYLHTPTFLLANVIIDIEPFLVILLELGYPLHGYLHTFMLAMLLGLILGYIVSQLEKYLQPLYKMFLLETSSNSEMGPFLIAGVLGTGLHVLLDAPLYPDIAPLYPVTINPFYNPSLSPEIYRLCALLGLFGIIYYVGSSLLSRRKPSRRPLKI